jgi:hypothetical protein
MGDRIARLKVRARGGRKRASLSASLVRRPGILAALLLDQVEPDQTADPGSAGEFDLWLRFVLTPEEAVRFRRWARGDHSGSQFLRKRFRQAHDDLDLEGLLAEVRSVLARSSGRDAGGLIVGAIR